MPSSSPMSSHDALSGFRDIKPVPEFHPFPFIVLWLFLAGLVVLALLLWAMNRRKQNVPSPGLPSPGEEALSALEEIARQCSARTIPVRTASTSVSTCMRRFVERHTGIPATDLTRAEIERALVREVPGAGMALPHGVVDRLISILSQCDGLTFGQGTDDRVGHADPDLVRLFSSTREWVSDTDSWINEMRRAFEERLREVNHKEAFDTLRHVPSKTADTGGSGTRSDTH